MTRYEVQTQIGNGWENIWHVDDEPHTFETVEEAIAELDDHLKDCREAVEAGHTEDAPERSMFRIVALPDPDMISVDEANTALCIMDWWLEGAAPDNSRIAYCSNNGSGSVRDLCLKLAPWMNAAWEGCFNEGEADISFDFEFVPAVMELIDFNKVDELTKEALIDMAVTAIHGHR